ncbi:MAG: energy-coupling factor transporter transmembrane protein EcfT [Clostridia bacterium]|nr:energy-coupling factor transporter transmembrane protein EcfT [Clostridia bacterium]
MKGVSFGQYYPSDSILHKLDPRTKVIMAVFYIVCTFVCKSAAGFLALTLSALALVFISRIPLRTILRSIRPLLFIIAFTSLMNIFFTQGERRLTPESWVISIYVEGLWSALFMTLRIMILIVGTSLFLTYTTTPIALTDALENLLGPLKKIRVPVHDFAMMMTIALRFIPTLSDETEKIMNAQKARGSDLSSGSLLKKAKALVPILIPLFVSAINRAFELAAAMECRCYHGGEGRTRLKVLRYRTRDWVAMLTILVFFAGIFALRYVPWLYIMG